MVATTNEQGTPEEAVEEMTSLWEQYKLPVMAFVIGAISGRYTGRKRARFENTWISGIYAGFSAYRDPRDAWWKQALVAFGQGTTWGLSDVYFPKLLNWISGAKEPALPPKPPEAPSQFPPTEEELEQNSAIGYWR